MTCHDVRLTLNRKTSYQAACVRLDYCICAHLAQDCLSPFEGNLLERGMIRRSAGPNRVQKKLRLPGSYDDCQLPSCAAITSS